MKKIYLILILFFLVSTSCDHTTNSPLIDINEGTETKENQLPSSKLFVGIKGNQFSIDGNPFYFAGTNAYYLPNYEKVDFRVVNNTFRLFYDSKISVIRMWAFYDGYDCGYSQHDTNENVIQTAPGVYSEEALKDLDAVVALGKDRGIRFILTLSNYWDELGGICQYNTWAGAENPSNNMEFFISNPNTQKWYKDYIHMLLNRTNTITGIAYKDEPAIFSWEIMNEARLNGGNPETLRNWYQEIAQYIKSIDNNHLVSTGEEGLEEDTPDMYSLDQYSNTHILRAGEGSSYILNTQIPEIDYGTAHWYPAKWGFGTEPDESLYNAQHAWIQDHFNIAKNAGKPFILGEYGFPGWGDQRVYDVYQNLWNHVETSDISGTLIWQLTADGVKCYENGGNICWPGGRQDEAIYTSFQNHIKKMNNR